jgi:hypothetical protein
MSIPELSGEQKAADEAAFAAAQAASEAAEELRQQQAAAFQESRTPAAGVTAGQEVLL